MDKQSLQQVAKTETENKHITPAPESGPAGQKRPNKKLVLMIAAAVAIVVVGSLAAFFMLKKDDSKTTSSTDANQNGQQAAQLPGAFGADYANICKERQVAFTASPLPIDQLGYIIPMGQMNDGHVTPTDHVYVAPSNTSAADNTFDVVMPADGTVVNISAMPTQYVGDREQQTADEDHRLVIAHSCKYYSIFIHVHQLSGALKATVEGLKPNESRNVTVELKAGDKLGKIGGNPVDWSLMDVTQRLTGFITPDLYKSESWKIHVVDPISVYKGSLKDQLIAKSLRSVEPYGGKIDYDVKGALVGNWFQEGTNGYAGKNMERYWDGHLSVVPDHIDPANTIVSIGNWEGKAAQMVVKGKVDPATVNKASGPIKYELLRINYTANGQPHNIQQFAKGITVSQSGELKGTIMFEVDDGEKLKVETFPGKSAAQVSGFTDAAKTYVR